MRKWSMVVKAQVGWQQFLTSARSSGGRNEDEKDKGLGEPKRCGKGEKKVKKMTRPHCSISSSLSQILSTLYLLTN